MPEVSGQGEKASSSAGDNLWSTLFAGPVAGVCSRFCVYPFDTVKARLQIQPRETGGTLQYKGTADAFLKILRKDGPQGLYRGFPVAAAGSIPANMAYFGGYELGKSLLPAGMGVSGDLAVGAVAQMVAGMVFTPVDVIKERLQVQELIASSSSSSSSIGDRLGAGRTAGGMKIGGSSPGSPLQPGLRGGTVTAVRALISERGVLGLMRGYWATNAVWIPWNMLFVAFNEQAKLAASRLLLNTKDLKEHGGTKDVLASPTCGTSLITDQRREAGDSSSEVPNPGRSSDDMTPEDAQLPPWALILCSAGAASLAGVMTHPVDVIKTRIQVMGPSLDGVPTSAFLVTTTLIQKEGFKAFTRGLTARLVMLAPGTALVWAIYEPVKRSLAFM
ncbi:hypothetical protein CEUSTIGMA_g4866.t1 [Chlamydomonas eustigma]|uniref:Mitochondrial carrier protein n=1 Tax=Chlamydomonas eustigma TaxID=1157962 RepID=A0A250X2Y3_9CHLO|nr:hypothetical protein CEUSTIGMA_g4866.t1 [Chlamydomonas eustigma]|eukprot:GAX77421.1 hypothetical protein CEUSTIGMA_g4866.t1 [Chlamydomonas eustigma]